MHHMQRNGSRRDKVIPGKAKQQWFISWPCVELHGYTATRQSLARSGSPSCESVLAIASHLHRQKIHRNVGKIARSQPCNMGVTK